MAVTYEVNLDVDARIADAFITWLHGHVRQVRALPGFTGARVFDVDDPPARAGRVQLCVQYRMTDAQALQDYLRDHAAAMRAEGTGRFGDGFIATRRVLRARAGY